MYTKPGRGGLRRASYDAHMTCAARVRRLRCCRGKTNFFEKRVGDYQKSGVMAGLQGKVQNFSMDEDF